MQLDAFSHTDLHVTCLQLLFKYNSLFPNRILLSLLHTRIRLTLKWFKPKPNFIVVLLFSLGILKIILAQMEHIYLNIVAICIEFYHSSEIFFLIFINIRLANPSRDKCKSMLMAWRPSPIRFLSVALFVQGNPITKMLSMISYSEN